MENLRDPMEDWDEDEVIDGHRFDDPRARTDEEADQDAEDKMEARREYEDRGTDPLWPY